MSEGLAAGWPGRVAVVVVRSELELRPGLFQGRNLTSRQRPASRDANLPNSAINFSSTTASRSVVGCSSPEEGDRKWSLARRAFRSKPIRAERPAIACNKPFTRLQQPGNVGFLRPPHARTADADVDLHVGPAPAGHVPALPAQDRSGARVLHPPQGPPRRDGDGVDRPRGRARRHGDGDQRRPQRLQDRHEHRERPARRHGARRRGDHARRARRRRTASPSTSRG